MYFLCFRICLVSGLAETEPIPGARVDGQWNLWGTWSECSRTCNGTRERYRLCTSPSPDCDGKICKKLNNTIVETVTNANNTKVLQEIQYDKCNQLCKF